MSVRSLQRQERALTRARTRAGSVRLTKHAAMRADELGFHETELMHCIANPENTYPGAPAYGPNRRVFQRGECCCVVDLPAQVVVTVLLRTPAEWEHGMHTRRVLPLGA